MSLRGHIVELQRRHEALEKELEKERNHHCLDEKKLLELKRKKLQLKDEISKLRQGKTLH